MTTITTTTTNATPAAIDLDSMTPEQLKAELAKQKAENEKVKAENAALATKAAAAKKAGAFAARVNEPGKLAKDGKPTVGGNVSITGLGRFPISVFGSQLITLTEPENILEVLDTALAGFKHLSVKEGSEAEQEAARKVMKDGLERNRAIYAQIVAALKKNAATKK